MFYKLIIIISIVMSSLGLQAVFNSPILPESITVSTESATSIIVEDSPSETTTILSVAETVDSCINTLSTLRFDILLWQGCNTLAIAPEPINATELAVVSQPTSLPSLVAQTSAPSWNLQLATQAGANTYVSIIPNFNINLYFRSVSFHKVAEYQQSVWESRQQTNITNSKLLQSVIMRC